MTATAPGSSRPSIDRLLHLGNVVIDLVLTVPALPERGADVLAAASRATPGGGFNVMTAAARQGLPVAYAGAHGSGPFAALARSGLAQAGIDVPGPLLDQIPAPALAGVMRRADWLTCSAREAAILTGQADPAAAARALASRRSGARASGVIVRTGPDGCLVVHDDGDPAHVPGFPVAAADTSGAGDTHTGTFIAALAGGAADIEAARLANAAAAWSVTRRGPATAPTARELARFLARSAVTGT